MGTVSAVAVVIVFFQLAQYSPAKIEKCLQTSLKSVPADLSVHIQDGMLSTNQTMPVFVWFNCNSRVQLLAVVDERATKDDISSYGAQALASSSDFIVRYKNYTYSFPYKKYVTQLSASKATLVGYIYAALDIIKAYLPLVTVGVLLLTLIVFLLLNALYLSFSSLMVLLFFKALKRHYSYRTVVHVGMHSNTLPVITSLLFLLFPVHIENVLLLFFFLIFIFQLVGVYEAHYVESSSHHK